MDTSTLLADLDALHAAGVLTDAAYDDARSRLSARDELSRATTSAPWLATPPPPVETPLPPAGPVAPGTLTDGTAADVTPGDAVDAEPSATPTSAPCPVCAVSPTVVTTATLAAIPATAIDGSEVAGGAVVHACPNCGALIEQFETTLDDAWATVEQRWLDRQHPEDRPESRTPAEPAPAGTTTEGSL